MAPVLVERMFQKVVERNNWGRRTFHLGGEQLSPRVRKIMLRFPDGSTRYAPVVWRSESQSVNDMGHRETIWSAVPYAKVAIYGGKFDVPLWSEDLEATVL